MKTSARDSAADLLVRGLRLCVHVAFAALLAFGLLKTGFEGRANALTLTLAGVLAAVYVAGTATERKLALRSGYGQRPQIPALWWGLWLLAVLGIWGWLVMRDSAFAYCAFPLFFILLHLIRPLALGLLAVTALLAWLIYAFWRTGEFGAGAVVGPAIGAGFSVVVFAIYEALVEDSLAQRKALAELEATRSELAAAQHAEGVAAERERFSGEIHDTLAQGLNAIVLTARAGLASPASASSGRATSVSGPPAEEHDGARAALATILELASANLAEAREIVRGSSVAAPARPDARLEQEIRAAIDRVGVGDLDVTVRDERSGPHKSSPLPSEAHRLIVLAASSLTANVVRHAGASRAVLTIDALDDGPLEGESRDDSPAEGQWDRASQTLIMDVVDNGHGFNPAAVPEGFGMTSLRDRVQRMGGTLTVESEPGGGTAVNLRIPLPPVPFKETP